MANKKNGFSAAEKKAYYMGVGAALAGGRVSLIQKVMRSMSPAVKESYKNGLNDGFAKNVTKPKKNKGR